MPSEMPNNLDPNPPFPQPQPIPAVRAFLSLIAWSEGTSTSSLTKNNGYDVIVSSESGPEVFTDYHDHPFASGRPAVVVNSHGNPLLTSTAAGRYQILLKWWRAYKEMLHLPDFTPQSQDAVAIRQMKERGAVELVEAGNIQAAITACSTIWASFPGNDYGQGGKSMEALLEKYKELSS